MRRRYNFIWVLLLTALLFTGCMRTVDQLYRVPKRSHTFNEIQAAIDSAMTGLSYCAPLSGENQQAVQMADLNGDGTQEYLVFARGDSNSPLRILVLSEKDGSYVLAQTIVSNGTSFDMIEYAQMDEYPGVEIVFGSQLTDKLRRNVAVYSFRDQMEAELLLTTNYTEFLMVDLNRDEAMELFVLKPGNSDEDNGIAELYQVVSGKMERSNEMDMSGPVSRLKRIIVGNIHGNIPAVYAASTVDDTALITDVYAYTQGRLDNVTFSNESGTSVKTMRNYYVYAADIDNDNVVELPYLMPMMPMEDMVTGGRQELIRWYAMTVDGAEVIKGYTFHNFLEGWYLELDNAWASQLTVVNRGNEYEFYIWNEAFETAEKVMSIFNLSDKGRMLAEEDNGMFLLHEKEAVIFAAKLEQSAAAYHITQDTVMESFHLIRQDWKTGET